MQCVFCVRGCVQGLAQHTWVQDLVNTVQDLVNTVRVLTRGFVCMRVCRA